MTQPQTVAVEPRRVGVILVGELAAIPALRMLVLHMNSLQREFVFELLPVFNEIALLDLARHPRPELNKVNEAQTTFYKTYTERLTAEEDAYDCRRYDRFGYVVASLSSISGNYYLNEGGRIPGNELGNRTMFVALGDWKKLMAPPSIVEFTVTLLVASVGFLLEGKDVRSRHFGTRGCIFDFTHDLKDTRYKVLCGVICSDCEALIREQSTEDASKALQLLARRDWLLSPPGPLSPASTAAALGYNLFVTKGISPTIWERIRVTLAEEGTKQVLTPLFALVGAALLFWLGLKGAS
jgi:hypothetical protein